MPEIRQNIVDDLSSLTTESWRTFRIMAETVDALDTLNHLDCNCVSIFGSARSKPDSPKTPVPSRLPGCCARPATASLPGVGPA